MGWSTSAKVSVGSSVASLLAIGLAWGLGIPETLWFSYGVHKFLHIMGVVIFVGNMTVGPLWVLAAWMTHERRHFAFVLKTLSAADMVFTVPGVQLTVWNGIFLAAGMGGVRAHPWLVESMVLLIVSSLLSVVLVLPWQERLLAATEGEDEAAMKRGLIWWSAWGTLVMMPFGVVAWLMVTKQALVL